MRAWGLPGKACLCIGRVCQAGEFSKGAKACLCIGRVYQAGELSKGAKEPEDSEGLVETQA